MRILIELARMCAQVVYSTMERAPRRRKVVLLSRQADQPSRDFRMLADALRHREPGLEVVVLCRAVPRSLLGRIGYLGESVRQMRHLSTASVCIVDGYIAPVSMLDHGPQLTVIQMWHALGAIKKFGLQAVGKEGGRSADLANAMRMHRNYDIVLCGGEGSVDAFSEAFGVTSDRVRCLGLPRVDALMAMAAGSDHPSARIQALIERFPRLADAERTRVLYAPTFRRTRNTAFETVVNAFSDGECTLIVKPHDLERATTSGDHVVDGTGIDVIELLSLVDVVITDYSAVAFEAAVLGKPTLFHVNDIDDYERDLGLNIDPRVEMPSVTSTDIIHLATLIESGEYTDEAVAAFRTRYISVPEGGCTNAIADTVFDRLIGS